MTTANDLSGLYPTMTAQAPASAESAAPASDAKSVTELQNDEAAMLYTSMQPKDELKATIPEHIAELRASDDARIYSAQVMLADARIEDAFANVEGVDDQTKAVAAAEWREVAADVGAGASEVNEFIEIARQATVNGPVTAETVEQWQQTAAQRLVAQYGSEAGHAFEMAKALVARDPRVVELIDHTRTGAHPDVIMMFARLAMKEKARGRL